MRHFNVQVGNNPLEVLLDAHNKPVTVLEIAVAVAEARFGDKWHQVTNGRRTVLREALQQDTHWLFHAAEQADHQGLDEIYVEPPMFAVIEYSSGFAVRHLPSSDEHWMSDGVDALFDLEDKPLSPGTPDFTAEWSKALNSPCSETLEAYFPQHIEED